MWPTVEAVSINEYMVSRCSFLDNTGPTHEAGAVVHRKDFVPEQVIPMMTAVRKASQEASKAASHPLGMSLGILKE